MSSCCCQSLGSRCAVLAEPQVLQSPPFQHLSHTITAAPTPGGLSAGTGSACMRCGCTWAARQGPTQSPACDIGCWTVRPAAGLGGCTPMHCETVCPLPACELPAGSHELRSCWVPVLMLVLAGASPGFVAGLQRAAQHYPLQPACSCVPLLLAASSHADNAVSSL